MNNERARGIFMSGSFRGKIEKFAIKRSVNLLRSSSLTKNMIYNYGGYASKDGKDTILDRMENLAGVPDGVDLCHLCLFNIEHDCVAVE